MSTSPLNPLLYEKLERYFGARQVEVANAGAANCWQVIWRPDAGGTRRYPHRRMDSSGEEYKVRCKRCNDHRARLQINHMWGVWDPDTQSRNLWLIHCWNEECYDSYDHQKWLYDAVYALGSNSRQPIRVLPGRLTEPRVLRPMHPPGHIFRLDKLAQRLPGHLALSYLSDRGFDPVHLGKLWDVGYCGISRIHHAMDRIYIPVYMRGWLVGWQTRYIGDDVNGVSFNRAKVPKYFSCPGMPRRLIAYNIERALRHPTLILVEGPADAWNTGPMATALLGKTMSEPVQEMIVDGMKRHGNDGVVVVALDPKPDKKDMERNKPHHIERVTAQLFPAFGNRVVPVYLPDQYDPGSIDRQWLREIVREQASRRDLRVTFAKPS